VDIAIRLKFIYL